MNQATERFLLRLTEACLFLVLCVPLIGILPVILNVGFMKATGFQVLVEVAFASWAVLALAKPAYRPPWRHPLVIALGAYLLVLLAAMPFALDPWRSFWSSSERMTDVANYLHFGAFFLVLLSVTKDWSGWKRWLVVMNAVAVVVDLIAYYQAATVETFTRALSTFGNPAHFAAFALLSVFVALILAFTERSRWLRALWIGSAFLHAAALVLSGARAGLLGLAVGLLAMCVLVIASLPRRKTRRTAAAALVCVFLLVAGSFLALRSAGPSWGSSRLPGFVSRAVYSDFGEDRLHLWIIALDGIKERPLFGWGMEGYTAVFDRHLDPVGRDAAVLGPWADRAHNQWLDTAVASGLSGLAAYLALFATAFVCLFRTFTTGQNNGSQRAAIPVIALFAAYLAHQFFLFDTTTPAIIVFFLLAFTVRLSSPEEAPVRLGKPSPLLRPAAACVVIACCVVFYFASGLPFVKAVQNEKGKDTFRSNPAAALEAFRRSVEPESYLVYDLRLRMAVSLNDAYNYWRVGKDALQDVILFVRDEMQASAQVRPYDFQTLNAAAFAARLAGMYDAANFDTAEGYAQSMLAIAPERAEAYATFGEIALDRGDAAEAVAWFEQALARAQPSGRGKVLSRLACAYAANREFEKAFTARSEAEAAQYVMDADIRFIAALAPVLDDPTFYPVAIEIVERQRQLFGLHDELYASAAILFYRSGNLENYEAAMSTLQKRGTGWDIYVRTVLGLPDLNETP